MFQFTLPCGERQRMYHSIAYTLSFNSRSRAGSDGVRFFSYRGFYVSIHAPVRGATKCRSRNIYGCCVSIHAPVRGATVENSTRFTSTKAFQFTLPCGERLSYSAQSFKPYSFNSRSRAGSDHCTEIPFFCIVKFQFTLPCGERR